MLITLASITALCVVAVIYPYILYPIILKGLSRRPVHRGAVGVESGTSFSLLFCAYNEAEAISEKIANLVSLRSKYPQLEVLAFDDGSTDGTAEMIERGAPFVRLIRGGGRNGKAHGMKLLAAAAQREFLVFTDANVLLHEDALAKLVACYASKDVGGVCGALHYLGADGTSTAAVGGLYWKLEEKLKDLESATGSVMGADGSIFSVRRELYPDFPDTVLDDFTVSMEVVFRGFRLIKSNDVIAYEHLVSARSDEFQRKIRISARAFHTHTMLAEKRAKLSSVDRFKYVSHKTLRWFGGGFLIVGATTGIATASLLNPILGAAAAGAFIAATLVGLRLPVGMLSSFVEIILAMIATLIGIMRAMRGQTFAIWNPAKSRST
jgi:cellulose synthase/poly-beta-1,6-N-acetylglucosamine synthase-like glycosyltransferase